MSWKSSDGGVMKWKGEAESKMRGIGSKIGSKVRKAIKDRADLQERFSKRTSNKDYYKFK